MSSNMKKNVLYRWKNEKSKYRSYTAMGICLQLLALIGYNVFTSVKFVYSRSKVCLKFSIFKLKSLFIHCEFNLSGVIAFYAFL